MNCPCLSGLPYDECCGVFHRGEAHAPTAERLMRSRYAAFAMRVPQYLLDTHHPSTRPRGEFELDDRRWLRLDILNRTGGGMLDTTGTVEFEAFWRLDDQRGSQRENSRFVREQKRWFYVGEMSV